MTRLMVSFTAEEADALAKLAYAELRDPREQIRLVVRKDLMQRGLLQAEPLKAQQPALQPAGAGT